MKKAIENFSDKINLVVILIILIPLLLNIIWFREGNIFGYAESGLPFYNFQNAYNANKDAWAHYALGFPTNISIAAKPSYWFLAQLQNAGIPGFVLQAFFFWIVLVTSGISIYLISKNLFPDLDRRFLLIAVLFYWFNPFSMVNVWNRFLNNFFVFYMLLPLAQLFFLKGLQSKKYVYAILIGLLSAILAYALTSIAFVLLLWFVLFYNTMFFVFINKSLEERLFIIKFFLLTFLFWCLTNFWWISQVFSYVYSGSFSTVEQTSFSPSNNHQILTILSQKLGNLIYILRFEHASFFSNTYNLEWVKLYTFPLVAFLCFIPVMIIFFPLFFKTKEKNVLFLGGLIILGIFLAKGNNPPFGELYSFAFTKIGFLQVFRNAFEKFGFLLPLAGAPLLAYGCFILNGKIAVKWKNIVYLFIAIWLIGIFGLPYWTGLVFTSNESPANIPQTGYQVKVPQFYKSAGEWLNIQNNDFRLLVFPLGNEGITYNWEKGYTGVELSNQILPVTSVSFQTNIPFYDDISTDLEEALLGKNDFTKAANLLNAKYIMTRNDIDWHTRSMRDPQNIFNKLKEKEKKGQFKMVNNFGGLTFWENLNWVDKKIYLSNQVVSISPQPKISDSQFISSDNDILIGDKVKLKDIKISQKIIHPTAKLSLDGNLDENIEGGQDIFPYIRFSPTSKIYNFLRFKEEIDLYFETNISDKMNSIIMLLGKRLVEAKSATEINNTEGILIALKEYEKLLGEITLIFPEYKIITTGKNKQLAKQQDLYRIFSKHKGVLKKLASHFLTNKEVVDKIEYTLKLIDSKLITENIRPQFDFRKEDIFPIRKRVSYKFNVTNPGEYELLWGEEERGIFYKKIDSQTILQIDDQVIYAKAIPNQLGLKSFGKLNLNSGIHEVSMNTPKQINLVDAPKEINLLVQQGDKKYTLPINGYEPYAKYTIDFDYWIKKGAGFEVLIESNNARINSGEILPDFAKWLGPDSYDFEEKNFSTSFTLPNTADAANLIFKVKPWNNCESVFFTKNKERCKDESFRKPYDRTTEVVIKNISVARDLVDEPILLKTGTPVMSNLPQLVYKKVDNTKYIVSVTEAKEPFVLVLSESYDPGWKIFTTMGSEVDSLHFLANVYANGWIIDKKGSYEIFVKFVPQDLLNRGQMISVISTALGVIILGIYFIKYKNEKK